MEFKIFFYAGLFHKDLFFKLPDDPKRKIFQKPNAEVPVRQITAAVLSSEIYSQNLLSNTLQ